MSTRKNKRKSVKGFLLIPELKDKKDKKQIGKFAKTTEKYKKYNQI